MAARAITCLSFIEGPPEMLTCVLHIADDSAAAVCQDVP
jgi:hypothetical protein